MVLITGEIASDIFAKERNRATENLAKSVHIDGFRKGKIPEAVLLQKFGEMPILEEMAQLALERAYPAIMEEHAIEALGRPEISITKLEKGSPLGFTLKTAVMPEAKLPDYKKIAKAVMNEEGESVEATEKEVDDVVNEIKNLRKNEDGTSPEVTDEFVRTLGNFTDLADFRTKVAANIKLEKEIKGRDKKRATILEKILEKTESELPDILIETELDRMIAQMKADVARQGGSFEGYLESTGKTVEDIRREMRDAAEKRVRFELILKQIGKKENLLVSDSEIEKEADAVLEEYKGADPERVGLYVEGVLMNEKVLRFLEEQK